MTGNLLQNLGNKTGAFLDKVLGKSVHPKTELYALSTLVINWTFERLYADRSQYPPYGLVKLVELGDSSKHDPEYETVDSFVTDKPFSELREYMTATMHRGLRVQLQTLDKMVMDESSTDPIKKIYARFKKALEQYPNLESITSSPYDFIEGGINSALAIMTGILEMIPEIYKRENEEDNSDAYSQIAQNNLILINRLAGQHMDDFNYLIRKVRNKSMDNGFFNPKYFAIDKTTNRFTIKNSKKTWADHVDSVLKGFSNYFPRKGCPAMVYTSNGSVIRNLWDWHVDISKTIYKNLYQPTL